MKEELEIVLFQTGLFWEEANKNRGKFEKLIRENASNADIMLLPEMFTTGFTMKAEECAETMNGPTVNWMVSLAAELKVALTGSIIIEEKGKYFNRLIWADEDGLKGHYDKRHLFRMARENDVFSAGNSKLIVNYKGWNIFPLVCYDLRFPVWSRNNSEVDLMLYVANWPAARKNAWTALLPARAIENQSYVAGLNRIGDDGDGISYSGNSALIDPKGEYIAKAGDNEETVLRAKINIADLRAFREKFPVWMDSDQFEVK